MAGNLPADTPPEVQQKISELERNSQRQNARFFTRAPFPKEVPSTGFVFAEIGGVTFLYTKVGDKLKRVTFTNVP